LIEIRAVLVQSGAAKVAREIVRRGDKGADYFFAPGIRALRRLFM
jgi:hypothetical protein